MSTDRKLIVVPEPILKMVCNHCLWILFSLIVSWFFYLFPRKYVLFTWKEFEYSISFLGYMACIAMAVGNTYAIRKVFLPYIRNDKEKE